MFEMGNYHSFAQKLLGARKSLPMFISLLVTCGPKIQQSFITTANVE